MDDTEGSASDKVGELREWLKQLTQPLVDSLDSRLRKQIDDRVDARVDATLVDRLSLIERAVADFDRALKELEERLARGADRSASEATPGERGPGESPSEPSGR